MRKVILAAVLVGSVACALKAPQSFVQQNGSLSAADFVTAQAAFADQDAVGLGVHFNAASCATCHETPVIGGSGITTELRAGHFDQALFVPAPGGTLITLKAVGDVTPEVDALPAEENARDLFVTPSLFGLAFVEAVPDATLRDIARDQRLATHGRIHGVAREVEILEAPGAKAIGRFGWADQHASLLSFAADALRNEMGITSPLQPVDNTFFGQPVDDGAADPEDAGGTFGVDVEQSTAFMRALAAPPRVAVQAPDQHFGELLFHQVGCATCHRSLLKTAPAGTLVLGGALRVSRAVGSKTFQPFSDFLLHDVGTGPAIVREGTPPGLVRTAPLWGLGTRVAAKETLLHNGSAETVADAILRHGGEAKAEAQRFRYLSGQDQRMLLAFLEGL